MARAKSSGGPAACRNVADQGHGNHALLVDRVEPRQVRVAVNEDAQLVAGVEQIGPICRIDHLRRAQRRRFRGDDDRRLPPAARLADDDGPGGGARASPPAPRTGGMQHPPSALLNATARSGPASCWNGHCIGTYRPLQRVADVPRSRSLGLRNLLSVTLREKTLRKILPPMGLMRASNARNVRPQGPSVMRTQFPASPDDIDLTALGAAVKRVLPKLLIATRGGGGSSASACSRCSHPSMPRRRRSRSSPRGSAIRSSRVATPARRSWSRCAWTRRRSPPTCARCSPAIWR